MQIHPGDKAISSGSAMPDKSVLAFHRRERPHVEILRNPERNTGIYVQRRPILFHFSYEPDIREIVVRCPTGARDFFLLQKRLPTLTFSGFYSRVLPPQVKRPERNADYSLPPRPEVTNEWSYTSTFSYALVARIGTIFCFYFYSSLSVLLGIIMSVTILVLFGSPTKRKFTVCWPPERKSRKFPCIASRSRRKEGLTIYKQ